MLYWIWNFVDWRNSKSGGNACIIDPDTANLELAKEVEEKTREAGAEPAHIAVLKGRIKIGILTKYNKLRVDWGRVGRT